MGKRKVCVVTGSRAEYGLFYWTLIGLKNNAAIDLQLCVTGTHLSHEHGLTYKEIESDGFNITRKIDMLLSSNTAAGISKSMGLAMIGFATAFTELNPDLLLVIGDRFETFAAVSAATIFGIPIAHCHGGELTLGSFDDSLRHAITKMSHIHFCAVEEYVKRVQQLGEDPKRVFLTGALGIENIHKIKLLDRKSFEESIAFELGIRNLLITFHPPTRDKISSVKQMEALLSALSTLESTHLIFTKPNADSDRHGIAKQIDEFVDDHKKKCIAFDSMGQLRYLSALQFMDGVVGNSSSGLIEVPSFKIGTINIGSRQDGRIKPESVIDCDPNQVSIEEALALLYCKDFRQNLRNVVNIYDKGDASEIILKTVKNIDVESLFRKEFFDLSKSSLP
ncbi:MAG: UDP-N-acetylglucosamine 2-epimerase (hydrolyzing) [Cyclobacteriaceae bacterium]|nr:UDP-N-acetylglucosamine 2-epimerase (hydrolyzing) [Cyclobacteriaceae bacterium HetDA_MAG_MS6]